MKLDIFELALKRAKESQVKVNLNKYKSFDEFKKSVLQISIRKTK